MKMLPIGIENFKELIDNKYYYVDKTALIKDVYQRKGCFVHQTKKIWENAKYEQALPPMACYTISFQQGKRKQLFV